MWVEKNIELNSLISLSSPRPRPHWKQEYCLMCVFLVISCLELYQPPRSVNEGMNEWIYFMAFSKVLKSSN